METNIEILKLIDKRKILADELKSMIYGALEIREDNKKKYIYVHQRIDGILNTKYVGEYNEELANLILTNSMRAKEIKKDIKLIDKKLNELGYSNNELTERIKKNIDFAKRNLVDTIYKQAILEGVATTYADTEDIILGGKVNNMTTDDVLKVINLKHAWEFILNENVIASPTNYALLSQINKLVEEGFYYNAGSLREVPVKIGGTNWQPTLPYESQVKENIDIIINNKEDSDLDKAISLLLYVTKGQLFIDGNKRTSVIFANHYLISKGLGLIVIPENKVAEYKKILIEYYEKNNNKIKDFIKKNCFLNINSEK